VNLGFGLAFLSGFVALSHEIIWYRVLSFTTGGAADAFALMLGAYLLGIALGSAAARGLCRDGDENVRSVPLQAVSYLFAASALAFLVPPAIAGFVTVVEVWQITLPLVVAAAERQAEPLDVLLLGGLPIRAPIAHYGPFVMNTRAEIVQAIDDYEAGRLGIVPADQLAPRNFA